ncbi:aspartokinase-homoserine dehydrogenase [Striga asiatica]|uniref:Homoserine dehydrogenase n=1 Tax=Striga asiatica TaxID=4170 RepID=A0A5A7PCW2_STRAF|nr:aspartokinase-homoserine dehydrogenase [Striga asiatica]
MICRPAGLENEDSQQVESPVKGFATIDNLALVNVEGTGMAGVPGTASAIFGAVKDVRANVIMISQASSEHSVCFAVPEDEVKVVAAALESRFRQALDAGRLSQANINIRAIAQGCSEYNVTVVLKREDFIKALRAVHSRFYLSRTTIAMGIIGPGLIAILKENFNIDLRVMGITGSKTMLLSDTGIDLSEWRDLQKVKGEKADMQKFVQHVHRNHFIPNTAIYLKLRTLQRQSYTHYFYEATVGAGLPIITTLQGLLETGDKILRVEGIFSGTLSYIFNNFVGARTFSEVVKEAKEAGYTEPDPRDDLSGTDVARKVIILARESGLKLELSDIPVQSLGCTSAEEFMQQLPQYDEDMAKQRQEAEVAGEVLRYVGVVDVINKRGTVELRKYKKEHPFAQLSGSDNIIAFSTLRYEKQPLIVRGPGAGAEVTAGGVFSDILRLASYLGAPS